MAQAGQKITVRDGATSTDVNGTLTSLSFTSEPIEILGKSWSLNTWFDAAVTGAPMFTVQVSNSNDINSFNDLGCAINIEAPNLVIYEDSKYRYVRFIYDDNGATGGNKYFDFVEL